METPKKTNESSQRSDKATSDMQLGEGGQGPNLAIGENLHEETPTDTGRCVGEDVGNVFGNVGSWKISTIPPFGDFFFGGVVGRMKDP